MIEDVTRKMAEDEIEIFEGSLAEIRVDEMEELSSEEPSSRRWTSSRPGR